MSVEKILDVGIHAGKMLMESGAEVYRVEETMNRICSSFHEVDRVDSYVTATGIMLSITVADQSATRIKRIRSRNVNLEWIESINTLSRDVQIHPLTAEQIEERLKEIEKKPKFSAWMMILFGAIGAGAFALFFDGNWQEVLFSFLIGFVIRVLIWIISYAKTNQFLDNIIASAIVAFMSYGFHAVCPSARMDTMIISGIMLLIPGLAITNAIRDTMSGDYLSGIVRAIEAIVNASAIAIGTGIVLSVVM